MREVLVIGGTAGIGGAAARGIAAGGDRVWVVGRDAARGEAVVADLRAKTGLDHQYLRADMTHMADVARLADVVGQRIPRLDALVHAAGLITWERKEGADGIEAMFGSTVLSRMLLTERVLPSLEAAPAPRVVIVTARVAGFTRYDADTLLAQKKFTALRRLQPLQLANHLWATTLPQRHPGLRTTVHLVHPGVVETAVFASLPRWLYAIVRLLATPFRVPVEVAAANVVALVQGGASAHGTLHTHPGDLARQRPGRSDPEAAAALWALCDGLLAARGLARSPASPHPEG